ncbi:hypothetical protein HU830_01170 [Lactobacillus sp. DCY120]|uniref:DUF5590 domain-containing protein n=1 Tax=Bombilactobacillus apium TaxID=2675299 RepID=A0A850QYL8_9LACO|nr:hypothetical protein [Bombilactobacillus apium]NVY95819.1 hypothetical protein [Bombilactobacillus apium]
MKRRSIIGASLIVFLAIIVGIYFALTSSQSSAHKQAVQIATTQGPLQKARFYSEFNRDKTYFCVGGWTKKQPQKYQYVLIDGQSGNQRIISGDDDAPQQARQIVNDQRHPAKIKQVALGYYRHQLVWEVSYFNKNHTLGYYLTNFKNTKIIQIIDNL